jgi:hypothetical protein
MKILDIKEPQLIETSPSVFLIITDKAGEINYLAQVGNEVLAIVLKTAAQLSDYPVVKQEFQLEHLGQELYIITDNKYFGGLVGTFLSLTWETSKALTHFADKEDLQFTMAINY